MNRFILIGLILGVVYLGAATGRGTTAGAAKAQEREWATSAEVGDLRSQVADLMRRVTALERQASATATTPTPTPRVQPTATATERPRTAATTAGGLEMLDGLTFKDAGIGDGTFYAFVEVVNIGSRTYDYVGIDGICRDANDRVIATGIGNELNVAPGEQVVIEVIFLGAEGCENVSVTFDGMTGLT